MSTRSRIGIERADGTVRSIYCHFDGYPEGVGATLKAHYTDAKKIEELLDLGDISVLGDHYDKALAEKAWKYNYDGLTAEEIERLETGTRPYADRGEECPARIDKSRADFLEKAGKCWEDYVYLFDGEEWHTYPVEV